MQKMAKTHVRVKRINARVGFGGAVLNWADGGRAEDHERKEQHVDPAVD